MYKRAPPSAAAKAKIPWCWRLPEVWARNLAARYFLGTFPLYKGVKGKAGKRGLPAVVESSEEKDARFCLRRFYKARKESDKNVKK